VINETTTIEIIPKINSLYDGPTVLIEPSV